MPDDLKYITFETEMGWTGVLSSPRGLLSIALPQASEETALHQLGSKVKEAARCPDHFVPLVERFKAYFKGEQVDFPDELDLSTATPFQRQVWQAARLIPDGETRSYLWLARQIGKSGAARAVGQALGRNPLPVIVPCHRVIASDGSLGGFTGGLEMKRRLLKLESR